MHASRMDAIARSLAQRPNRRRAIKLLAAFGLGGVLLHPAARPAAALAKCPETTCPQGTCIFCEYNQAGTKCRCICKLCTIVGIAGGGAVALTGGGEATLALLATRTEDPGRPGVIGAQGQVAWLDPAWEGAGLAMESIGLAFYGPITDVEGGREVAGWLRADQVPGEHPFVLRAIDAGPTRHGQDTVMLWVGASILDDPALSGAFAATPEPGGFRYHAAGTLAAGDLRLVSLPSPTEAAEAATPAP